MVFYALRRDDRSLDLALIGLVMALAAAAVICWWRARRMFFGVADARVLLESHLRLDTRLTAAQLGLVPWPREPAQVPAVLEWRLRVPVGWAAVSVALITVALLAPVPRDPNGPGFAGPPPALLQTEAMLAALKDMKVADPQGIEQLEERARELARRPAGEQYSHSALEAADALRNQTAVAAAGLGRNLDAASNALRSANRDADMKSAAGRLAAALSGLRDGTLPANKDLLSNLPANEADLKGLTAGQRAQLAQQLADAAACAGGVAGAAGAGAAVARPDGQLVDDTKTGAGGPGGGGESAPLMLSSQASDAGTGEVKALQGDALKRFALSDKLGTTTGAHEVDRDKPMTPVSAGRVAAPGLGGEAVWVDRLTPAERAAVKNFFK